MQITRFPLQGPALLTPVRHEDDRGWFAEIFRQDLFRREVADVAFVQENQSQSRRARTLRGLHFQRPPMAQGKLVRCVVGAIFDVAVDIRRGSPQFGRHVAVELDAASGAWFWVPPGFAHGFCTLTEGAEVHYKVTAPYAPDLDDGIAFNDPMLGIDWPIAKGGFTVSAKDLVLPRLADRPPVFTMEGLQ